MRLAFLVSLAMMGLACKGDDGGSQPANDAATESGVDPDDFVKNLPTSCAFDCKNGCPDEAVGPFTCPSMDAWDRIPHAESCGGAAPTLPTPVAGKCTVSAPTGEALRRAGPADPGVFVLPDGHRLTPLGSEAVLVDDTHVGGFPIAMAKVPGTKYALVVEAGYGDHLVRAIDLDALANKTTPVVVSTVRVDRANWGVAIVDDVAGKHRAYVSGGALGKIWSLSVDDATGALALDEAKTIDLGMTMGGNAYFSAGIAVTPDKKRLVTTAARSPDARIVSLDTTNYGMQLATASLGAEQFGVAIDPADASGEVAWIAMWQDAKVVAVDTKTGEVKRTIATGKNPEGMAFLDARYMVVAASDGDSLTVIDRVTGSGVGTVPIEAMGALHGWSPSALTYDSAQKKLYVAESIINAVEVFDVALGTGAPMLASAGRLPTAWWPSDLMLDAGRLVVLEARGYGTGTGRTGKAFGPGEGEIAESMRGTIRSIDLATVDLGKETAKVKANAALADASGYPTVTCPGADYDFPVPRTNTEGPSKTIKHVFFVVRENKAFDGVLGDMSGVDGDPKKVLSPTKQDVLWRNFRGIGKTWTIGDNYYTDAEFSSQGHVWATYGRTNDFTERVWHIGASGKGRDIGGGLTPVGRPEEGSIFEWMLAQNVEYDIMGEGTGLPKPPTDKRNPLDIQYPGIAQNVGLEDVTKACYFAARARVRCDLHDFAYITLPNDHTFGGGSGRPTPETMIAVNDEATGTLLDALGRSPYWQDSLVIITEDDPQDGGDHVDLHRTPIVFAGPWVKKGYVAKGHYDVASLVKLFAHLRGLPYPNAVVARAPLPLEMFTSTPDYATWTALPRTEPRACNAAGSAFATEAAHWDWDDIDEQPGLGRHVEKMLRATPEERGPLLEKVSTPLRVETGTPFSGSHPDDDDG